MFYGKSSGPDSSAGGGGGSGRGVGRQERFDQMLKQQQLIEQKKKEIQARMALAKGPVPPAEGTSNSPNEEPGTSSSASTSTASSSESQRIKEEPKEEKEPTKIQPVPFQMAFNNDGSFLEQFKKMQEETMRKKKEEEASKKIKEEPIEYDEYGTPLKPKPVIKLLHATQDAQSMQRKFESPDFYDAPPPPPPPPPRGGPSRGGHGSSTFVPQQHVYQAVPPPPPPPPVQNTMPKMFGFPSPKVKALASVVAEQGDHVEDELRMKHQGDPLLWFLYKPDSTEYKTFRALVSSIKSDLKTHVYNQAPPPPPPPRVVKKEEFKIKVEPEAVSNVTSPTPTQTFVQSPFPKFESTDPCLVSGIKRENNTAAGNDGDLEPKEKKRRSRWGPQATDVPPVGVVTPGISAVASQGLGINLMSMPLMAVPFSGQGASAALAKVTRANPQLLAYAKQAYGRIDLDEDEWKQCEEAYKMNMVFQDIARKKAKDEELEKAGKFKYEYDSDEETDGGTWEHRMRMKEMEKTRDLADELTKKAKGKHHIGDFLPPDQLSKFMEKYKAVKEGKQLDESEYQEYKIQQDNIGFKMLQKMGWSSGEGLGAEKQGIIAPIDKGNAISDKQGLGVEKPGDLNDEDDEYTAYRKRMMLAYRFRPNPLNNPRRAYY